MKSSVIGTVISGILLICILVVTPLYYIGIVQWSRSESEVQADVRNLIDEVIDTRYLTKDMLEDFNLSIAAKSQYYKATIIREVKVVNPDPMRPGETYTSYLVESNIDNWNQGDLITVKIEPVGTNLFRSIAKTLLGLDILETGFQFTGRVR